MGSSASTVDALTAKIARLQAKIAGRDPFYAALNDPAVAEQIGIERSLHSARMADLASLTSASAARETQAQRAVAEAEAALHARLSARDAAQRQLELMRPLVQRGIEPQVSLIQLENGAAASSDAEQAAATVARARSAVATCRRIMPALAARDSRAVVRAPVSGRVNLVLVSTVGSSVAAGQPIVEVVPSADALIVEALVTPKDIASIHIGQRAGINVTACDSAVYGGMAGQVVTISPDATVDERTDERHCTVRVHGEADTFRDREDRRLPIGAGMTADVNLLGDRRSVMAYILIPFTRLSEDAFRE